MSRHDPAWLEVQYNNRVRVPEHAAIFERWRRASALARDKSMSHIDVAYGDGPNETLDVFTGPASGAPVMVFIHGGWWRSLDKSEHSFIAPAFTRAGALVVMPNYALCPAVTIETIALQMTRALAWTYRNAARYGGDPTRIALVGHSAGGHLATMLMACRWREVDAGLPEQLVRSVLSISGLFDLEPLRHTPFLQTDLRLTAATAQRLSPAHFPRPDGRLYAVVGAAESEEFLRQNSLIRAAWGERVVPVCETIPNTNHFDVLHPLADPDTRLHRLALHQLGLGEFPG